MRDAMHLLGQTALWLAAVSLTVILVGAITNALHERREDRDAFDPDMLRRFREHNATIARRRAANETAKQEPDNAA